jgi:serine/threonine protein kinase
MSLDFTGTERFQVLSRLGAGGMGVVYAAYDREQRARVALKTLKEPSPEALLRLKTEFRALQEIRHRNLVALGELHEAGGRWFFTMEFVDGVDFLRWVRPEAGPRTDRLEDTPSSHGPLSGPIRALPALPDPVEAPGQFDETRLRAALVELGRGLGALHAAQCVHRDIKPSNLLVTREGRVVVLDFGLVAHLGEGLDAQTSSPGMAVGTAAYMAPEQAIQAKVGPEADWYAVGVVLYEALTGRLPFAGSAVETIVAKQLGEPTRPRVLCADVPADLDRLCMDLLQVSPRQRPTGPEVLERLRAVGSGPVATAPPASRTAAFVGRSRELADLMSLVSPLAQGAAATVVLHGRSGVGKSELLAQFMRRLGEREPQAVALSGRCYERESVPFKAFDGIVDSLSRLLRRLPREQVYAVVPRNARLLARVFPVLNLSEAMGGVARSHSDVHEPQELRTLAFSALRELLARLSDRFLVVMAIDDLQWADDDSVEILRALTQPPEAPAMLLVATWRTPGEARQAAEDLRRAQAIFPGGAALLEVSPLPAEDARCLAAQLVADLEGRTVAPGDARVEAIASEAEGHPLFIHELVRHTAAALGQEGPDRIHLDDVLWTRVSAQDPQAREVVELVSVAAGPIPQRLAGEVLGRPQGELTLILGLLRSAHLVRTSGARPEDLVEPYHDRIREAVLAGMSADTRRDWHVRLARAIAASEHPDPEVLSLHHEAVGDVDAAARYAAQAAQRAAARRACTSAPSTGGPRRAATTCTGSGWPWPRPWPAPAAGPRRPRLSWRPCRACRRPRRSSSSSAPRSSSCAPGTWTRASRPRGGCSPTSACGCHGPPSAHWCRSGGGGSSCGSGGYGSTSGPSPRSRPTGWSGWTCCAPRPSPCPRSTTCAAPTSPPGSSSPRCAPASPAACSRRSPPRPTSPRPWVRGMAGTGGRSWPPPRRCSRGTRTAWPTATTRRASACSGSWGASGARPTSAP